ITDTSGILVGMVVTSPVANLIPANTTVTAVTPTSITLSNNAGSSSTGALLQFNSSASAPLPIINEVQQIRVVATGTANFSFNGVSGVSVVSQSTQVAPASLKKGDVANNVTAIQNVLNSIPALFGNVIVTATSDPDLFDITFGNGLAGQNVAQLVS